ncbi:MAG: peptidylprolyl isomerase [Deltaproteobacteria bacterium]|nr:peptidylprolyl isomerase [Deltaproteobacteria bacterium]
MIIEKDRVVEMHYTLTDKSGEVLDSSRDDEPLAFLCGYSNIIPGLEKALEGLKKGDKKVVSVEAKDAYGDYDETLSQTVERKIIDDDVELETGMVLYLMAPHGPEQVVVKSFDADTVTLDLNHPLAGMDLEFDVEIMNVREGTQEELLHGHVHSGDHHHH